jgi:hypothetical protein
LRLRELLEVEKWLERRPQWNAESSELRYEMEYELSIGGTIIGGLSLRGKASKSTLARDVMFQLEVSKGFRTKTPLARLDWKPFHNHDNDAIGPPELRLSHFTGTHYHCFYLNYFEDSDKMRSGNLPLAKEVQPEPESFDKILAFCEIMFNISNMRSIPIPNWDGDLFRP